MQQQPNPMRQAARKRQRTNRRDRTNEARIILDNLPESSNDIRRGQKEAPAGFTYLGNGVWTNDAGLKLIYILHGKQRK